MWKAATTAFVLFAAAFAGAPSQVTALSAEPTLDAVTRWEYRVLTKEQVLDLGKKDLAAGLNTLGEEGWELAAVEPAYIFKRPRQQKALEGLRRQVSLAESDVAMWQDRVAWSERMARKGYLTEKQAQADKQRLQSAESALEKAKRELKALPTEPKKRPGQD
jgi:hypothetical protein